MPQEKNASRAAGESTGTSKTWCAFLERSYVLYWTELYRYVRSRFGSDSFDPQDVTQQAFVHLAALSKQRSVQNPRAFLYRAAINIAIDHKRSTLRRDRIMHTSRLHPQTDSHDDLDPERLALGVDELRIMEEVILGLAERDRTIFLLNRLEGISFAEIARRTGQSPSGVRLIVETTLQKCQLALRTAESKRGRQ